MSKVTLTDNQWQKILPFLKEHPRVYVGQEEKCRQFVEAALWIARSGAQWRLLPQENGKWNSVCKRFARWSNHGVFDELFEYFNDDADMENVMLDIMYDLPDQPKGTKVAITEEVVLGERKLFDLPETKSA